MTFLGGIKSAEHEQSASMRIVKHLFGVELLSVGVSATITALAYWLIVRCLPDTWQHLAIYTILPISAPLFEKPVFLVPYVWVGLNRARKRNGRWVLISAWEDIKEVLRENEFLRILRADILYHDTGYTSILFLLTVFVPVTSSVYAGVEAAIAFGIAVLLAAYLEVEFVNWRFHRLVKKLKAQGGRCERYLEIRYLVMGLESARAALAKIKRFCQSQVDEVAAIKGIAPSQIVFHDPIEHSHQYWEVIGVTIPRFNDWHSYLLIRRSEGQLGLHVAFWRTLILPPAEDSVTGLTCVEKIKIRFPLSEVSIDEVQQILARMGRVFRFEDAANGQKKVQQLGLPSYGLSKAKCCK